MLNDPLNRKSGAKIEGQNNLGSGLLKHVLAMATCADVDPDQEVINTLFCPSQEKFHTFVLRGVRNISEAP